MREAVICEQIRAPIGRYGGVFQDLLAAQLARDVLRSLVERPGAPVEH